MQNEVLNFLGFLFLLFVLVPNLPPLFQFILMETFYDTEFAQFTFHQKILLLEFKPEVFLDVITAQKVTEARFKIQNERAYAILCNITGITDSDKSGRDYFAKHSPILAKAIALYAGNNVAQTIANFYIRYSAPKIPTQLFTTMPDTLAFLQKHT